MRIGFTYDLRDDYLAAGFSEEQAAEFDRPDTIDAITTTLTGLGHEVSRIGNLQQLMVRLLAGDRWDLVFNIAEGLHGVAREAQVPALLDAFGIPYVFSDAAVLALCLHKGLTKRVVRDAGIATPDFELVESLSDLEGMALAFPVFAKPVAEGTSKGVGPASRIGSRTKLRQACQRLLAEHGQPVLVERYLPGLEFTVGILGTDRRARVLGVLEVSMNSRGEPDIYTWLNKEEYATHVDYRLVDDTRAIRVGRLALAAWRALGCRDGGRVDVRLDADGVPQFLEVNPLPGLNPLRSDLAILATQLGWPFERLIDEILTSALERVPQMPQAGARRIG